MKSILNLLSNEVIEDNIYPRIRPEKHTLVDKIYDVKLTPTTHGNDKRPCFKITFGNHEMVREGGYLEFSPFNEIIAMRVVPYSPFKGRVLSFERSSGPKEDNGSFGVKISCDDELFSLLKLFEGTHVLHKKEDSDWYYIYRRV